MILKQEYFPYISGDKFDAGYKFKIGGSNKINESDRIKYLVKVLEGKSVIHLGCTDHVDYIEQKIREGNWLHKIITDVSSECIGIDINQDAIDFIHKRYAGKKYAENIYMADITTDFLKDHNLKAEYLLMGEILEHIDDPVKFLREIIEKNRGYIKKIIITVPNMYGLYTRIYSWFNIEYINTDHRYWFSPITLWKIATRAGLNVESIDLVSSPIPKKINLKKILRVIKKLLLECKPLNREHIVLIAEID